MIKLKLLKQAVKYLISCALICSFISACTTPTNRITYNADRQDPKIQFAINEIAEALNEKGIQLKETETSQADLQLLVRSENREIEPEGFQIKKSGDTDIELVALDQAGVMYGGLELAEQIRLYGWKGIKEVSENPYMEMRGTKFNIPLDVRTPSYSDVSDAAQNNLAEMWNFDFWKEYIDNLARYRYNFVSLWSLHPFPSMVKVPGYEEVALDNVERSSTEWKEYYSRNGIGFNEPDILSNTEVIKEITIDQKIDFWKKVMAYGKSRNVDFYLVTWNIFVYGTDGKYGITDDIDNPVTRDYFRKSVKQMFVTYPDLAGIGLTTGENMHGASTEQKEDWAYDAYAEGALEAAREMPNRRFKFIHRQHQTGALEIVDKFKSVYEQENLEFLFSFKYAKAHVYSATEQPYHTEFVNEIKGLKTIWTLRNDDIYYFKWGAPDFVREFIKNIPYQVSRGYYYGSDQWIWGREFLLKHPDTTRQLEIVKHWYHWMMWGRLGYNPNLDNQRFIDLLNYRFPEADARKLFTAWQEASMVYPTTTGFHWGDLDFKWYIEACKGSFDQSERESGFHGVNKFILLPPHKLSGFQSIPDFVQMTLKKGSTQLKTPIEVSLKLHDHADSALKLLGDINPENNKELALTLHDIRTISMMGKYYAHKIAGSSYVALYRETRDSKHQASAIKELTAALDYWKEYTSLAMQEHKNPLWTNRVGHVDWVKLTKDVEQDIQIAKDLQ